jgi:Fur family ferric uptake transcriptional regulator
MDIGSLLSKHHLRTTTPRKVVFATLKNATRPLSQMEIANANTDIDKVSVYRTIELYVKLGIVTGVAHGWKQRYELAAPLKPHHHHLLCTNCGKVEDVRSEELEQVIHNVASQRHFKVTGHTFEVTGLCGDCR